ncbi:hypothetical protein ALC60_01803 [Trachymyrmex zeteki]|uniref:Uncharacterized protein n=1 Tax=Mycetomoellerius zeteki TaxID=64791 RepID=A0A151XFT3_9HYME|nr:hypothetical protein ALC60_01803 [Trachymyrmex zeteki]
MRNFCVRVASHRRVPASRKSLHSLGAEFPEGSLPDQRQSDGIFDKAIFWFVHSATMAAAMGVWSSDYGIARAIVDRKINNPLSRKASQSETEEFSRPNSVVKRPPPLTAPPPTRLLHPLFSNMPPPPDTKATPVHYTLQRHIHAYRRIRTRATEEEAEEDEEEEEEKIVRRAIGNVSPTYNRQGVDSRLLDLRQSNFANETYPVTQLASTQRAHARTHVN